MGATGSTGPTFSVAGSGLVKTAAGVTQSPATLLVDADVSSTAAINQSKVKYDVLTKTANYTLAATDSIILANATADTIEIVLPAPSAVTGRLLIVKKIDNTANEVVISCASLSALIEGNAGITFSSRYQTLTVISDGTNYYKVAPYNL
jgi:hypothetical protein